MVASDQCTAQVFPEPPLTAFRRQKNIGEYLIRGKVPQPISRSKRDIKRNYKMQQVMSRVETDNFTWKITQPVNCETESCVYMIECNKENVNRDTYEKQNIIRTSRI